MKKVEIIPVKENALFKISINQAKTHIPEWYKKSPQRMRGHEDYYLLPDNTAATTSTYKKCVPFLDTLTNGYMFSLTQDIEVRLNMSGEPFVVWRTEALDPIKLHSDLQWEGLEYPKHCHKAVFKWENYFVIKTPKNYSTLFTHPHNRFDLPFHTFSGIVDTDKFTFPVNFPFFLKKDFSGIIPAGTPLAQITFFKREHWFKNVKKYKKDYAGKVQFDFFSKIDRSYKNQFWDRKDYD